MHHHTIRAVIFDLDGTLLDTEDISTRATEMVLRSYTNARIDWTTKQQILGMRGEDWSNVLIRKYNLEDKLSANHLVLEWEKNMGLLCNEMEKMIGADKITQNFSSSGIPIAIATSSSYDSVEKKKQFHKELFDRVDVIVCGDDSRVINGKPSPDIYLLTASLLQIAPEHCLVFEDAYNGVLSASRAGMHVVACPDKRLGQEQFLALTPHVIPSLEDFDSTNWNFVSTEES